MLRYNTKEIIEKFKEVHGDLYDYSQFEYLGYNTHSVIICNLHGKFNQTAHSHIDGQGCKTCGYIKNGNKLNKGVDYYITKANLIYNNKYDYSLLIEKYTTQHKKYEIICPEHGIFVKNLANHVHSHEGCPKCSANKRNGFVATRWIENSKNRTPRVYLIRIYNESENFLKIGITYKTIQQRFKQLPYKYEILSEIIIPEKGGRGVALIELELHLHLQHLRYTPKIKFKGDGECYNYNNLDTILKQIRFEVDLMRMTLMVIEDLAVDCIIVKHNNILT